MPNEDWHAGIYLGMIDGDHFAFAQYGHGMKFGPESIRMNYDNPDYFIPSTLKTAPKT